MNNNEFTLREKFLNELKSYSGSDISEIYRHLFICMEYHDLESILTFLKDDVNNEHWFPMFHKSMRVTDFYGDVFVNYGVDTTSSDEKVRMDELRTILPMHPNSNSVNTEKAKNMKLEGEMNEFRKLNKKSMVKNKRCVSSNLDMVLWNLIHLDTDNFLQKFIENFFNRK
jgi:hypothetical protein